MAASSSSSSAAAAKKYDVFISFRGEDTRHSFVSHLYQALCSSSIRAYIDRELSKGDDISPSLFQAIEGSCGSLVVFSNNYAFSKWCLNELVKILECRNQGHFVIPVFYNIDPSQVRKQTENYKKAFEKHEQNPNNKTILEKWKAALKEAADIAGYDSRNRDESELIQEVVEGVLQKLDNIYLPSKSSFVGIDKRRKHIEELLLEFLVVGIWGMGGIGKTTIAREVFDKISSQYDNCCFFENVKEESCRGESNQLLGKLLHERLKNNNISINPQQAQGLKHAMRRLSNKNVLIVLDDVDNYDQLEHLGQECESFTPKSRVIITTRNKHLLTRLRVEYTIYEVEGLDNRESFELFRLHAFKENCPRVGFEKITTKIVNYAQGLPLALKTLGILLCSKSREEWESLWKKLKKIRDKNIIKVLELSYDGLDHEEKQIFLDIACFFKGENKEELISLLESFGFHGGAIGIRTLQDRALITIAPGNTMQMHDLIQEMGRQIVCEESVREPGRRSRLWDPEEVYDVLRHSKGTHNIEGIILDMSQIKDLHLNANAFKKMINLRYLNFYSFKFKELGKIHVPINTQLFSDKLRYLHWDKCPLRSLSSNFCAEKLVELNMPGSHIKKLWNGVQDLVNLKGLDLSESKQLMALPDFSKASNIELVRLSGCINLCHVHPSILSSHKLEAFYVNRCKKLMILKSEVHLESLKTLDIWGCTSLKEFSLSSEKLKYLNITDTSIEILHSSIGLCKNLESLTLSDSFKKIPSDLSKLRFLKSLRIFHCTELDTQNLHTILGSLLSLREVTLIDCLNLSQLPDNIKYLPHLTSLDIRNCVRLPYISELPSSIETVWLANCTSLETIVPPKSVEYKPSSYILENCVKLDEHSLSSIVELTYFRIKQATAGAPCKDLSNFEISGDNEIFFPGNRVPSWFRYQAAQNWISIEIPPCSRLLGFAFCCILSPEFLPYRGEDLEGCGCNCYLENSQSMVTESKLFQFLLPYGFDIELISNHVCIWYDQLDCNKLLDEMEKQNAEGQRNKVSFQFYVEAGREMSDGIESVMIENAITECAVWPIYASEYENSINDLESRKGMKLGYKIDDIDEPVELQFDELRPSTSAIGLTSSILDLQDQPIFSQNARFSELDNSTMQFGKIGSFPDLNEMPMGGNSLDANQQSPNLSLWLNQGSPHMNPFDIWESSSLCASSCSGGFPNNIQMAQVLYTSESKLNSFSVSNNSITQFGQVGFCPDLNEMPMDENSLHIDQQSPCLSLNLNQGHPQMNSFDIGANSGLYAPSSSISFPGIVYVFGSFSFSLNQEDPLVNLLKEIEVGGFPQEDEHEQEEQCVTGNEISCGCFISLLLKPLWRLFSTP